mmetsp:Transcript_1047/g.1337  ORF Transcript_1047/g.1337 Transcript_1047/m.1337 type:complete len:240 (-) Transcript_1047:55-774(-)|eukprot:CAMPEP_0178899784 /NCGR_PEP_ID=MMETSP0786-20121207/3100_1 /TAXON_ID=186022 /ORGANISM="Thalassionema frauenfeldii, Strain CCMP 1798" /LENGTH=239 /DNA_ID=CAMNT_0020570695 /DNA_START=139 /DNA_END=858 /DNA_ORIENTATION=+
MAQPHLDLIQLNNIGVQNIEQSDIKAASDILATAVKLILKDDASKPKPIECPSSKHIRFEWSKIANLGISAKCCEMSVGQYVFSRGMYIYGQQSKKTYDPVDLSSDAKAAIVYNAGLAYHLLAVEKSDSLLLRKASHMYRYSQSILRKANRKGSHSKLCFNYFFHVSILNNLGQISYELVDYNASTQYFDKLKLNLKHLIAKSMSPEIASRQRNTFHQNDLRGMISNTVIEIPNTAPCA